MGGGPRMCGIRGRGRGGPAQGGGCAEADGGHRTAPDSGNSARDDGSCH